MPSFHSFFYSLISEVTHYHFHCLLPVTAFDQPWYVFNTQGVVPRWDSVRAVMCAGYHSMYSFLFIPHIFPRPKVHDYLLSIYNHSLFKCAFTFSVPSWDATGKTVLSLFFIFVSVISFVPLSLSAVQTNRNKKQDVGCIKLKLKKDCNYFSGNNLSSAYSEELRRQK